MFSKDATLNLFLHAASPSTILRFHRKSALDLFFSLEILYLFLRRLKTGRASFDDVGQKDKISRTSSISGTLFSGFREHKTY